MKISRTYRVTYYKSAETELFSQMITADSIEDICTFMQLLGCTITEITLITDKNVMTYVKEF